MELKKIMFLYHVKEREYEIISLISQQISRICSDVEIRSGELYSSVLETIQFMPDVIVSIPPRDFNASNYLTVLKVVTGAVVISMNTEGYYIFTPEEIRTVIGFNSYAKELVDYYLMWGEKTKNILGDALYESGKVTSKHRIKSTGYVWYEKERVIDSFKKYNIYETLQKWLGKHKKNILIITGFLIADSSIKDYQEIGYFGDDKPLNKRSALEITKAQESIAAEYQFREKYINMIISLAKSNPEMGIVVKLHPIEIENRVKYYNKLSEYSNIFLIKQPVPVGMVLNYADALIHYNSTCKWEAYIYKVPTIQMYDDSKTTSYRFDWQTIGDSTYVINISDFQELDGRIKGGVTFRKSQSVEKALLDLYNWKFGKPYKAIEKNAYYISMAKSHQRLRYKDKEVLNAINSKQGRNVINMLVNDAWMNLSSLGVIMKDIYALCKIFQYSLFHKFVRFKKSDGGGKYDCCN